ncbi:MAG: hypothetical protein R3A79_05940 [Nannocystaceae bacterium]
MLVAALAIASLVADACKPAEATPPAASRPSSTLPPLDDAALAALADASTIYWRHAPADAPARCEPWSLRHVEAQRGVAHLERADASDDAAPATLRFTATITDGYVRLSAPEIEREGDRTALPCLFAGRAELWRVASPPPTRSGLIELHRKTCLFRHSGDLRLYAPLAAPKARRAPAPVARPLRLRPFARAACPDLTAKRRGTGLDLRARPTSPLGQHVSAPSGPSERDPSAPAPYPHTSARRDLTRSSAAPPRPSRTPERLDVARSPPLGRHVSAPSASLSRARLIRRPSSSRSSPMTARAHRTLAV